MFDRLKKVFVRDGSAGAASQGDDDMSRWAASLGLAYQDRGDGKGFTLAGEVKGRSWRMERGRPSRDFITGEEIRARGEMGVSEDPAVMIMNRPLKEALEKRAFALYTDSLQTTVDPNLPEELRWLSMYEEVGWDGLPMPFWNRYSVFADEKVSAQAWIQPRLAQALLAWPQPGPADDVPFIMMLLRGKTYIRAQYLPMDMPTLEHFVKVYQLACEDAIAAKFESA